MYMLRDFPIAGYVLFRACYPGGSQIYKGQTVARLEEKGFILVKEALTDLFLYIPVEHMVSNEVSATDFYAAKHGE